MIYVPRFFMSRRNDRNDRKAIKDGGGLGSLREKSNKNLNQNYTKTVSLFRRYGRKEGNQSGRQAQGIYGERGEVVLNGLDFIEIAHTRQNSSKPGIALA